MVKHLHENMSSRSESRRGGPDTVHLGGFVDYCKFRDNISKITEERSKLLKNLKGLSKKEIQKIFSESGISFMDGGTFEFADGDFKVSFGFKVKAEDIFPGIWYFVDGRNYYVEPNDNDGFHDNAFSPDEGFPGQWSEDNLKKYLEFSNKLMHELEKLNLKIENDGDAKKGKLSKLFGKLFD